MMSDKKYVTYEEFGAVGDGKTNDFEAMMLAHEYANENHLPVKADGTKTYLIGSTEKDEVARSIVIKTETDFGGATIIIDDTDIPLSTDKNRDYNGSVFTVLPEEEMFSLDEEVCKSVGALKLSDTKINVKLGYPAMIVIYDDDHRAYIRFGPNANKGEPQHELLLIDGEGNIDPTTPLMHDYNQVTRIDVIKIEMPYLTVQNGKFVHRASHYNTTSFNEDGTKVQSKRYFVRNFRISRSNTTVRNLSHYVEGEISLEDQANNITGPAYRGFYNALNANNVTIEDCVVTARRYYTPGTYGFSAGLTNNIVLRNCRQSNFYIKDERGIDIISMEKSELTGKPICWGLGGTSYCKNMVYDGCEITRFDAHQGLCNGKIINSKVAMIAIIGFGDMLVENSTLDLVNSAVIHLRLDYGSTWEGTVTIRNCDITPNEAVVPKNKITLLNARWHNHYYGYPCHVPNLVIDNVRIHKRDDVPVYAIAYEKQSRDSDSVMTEPSLHLPILSDGVTENKNPLHAPEFMKIINNNQGTEFIFKKLPFFENTKVEGFTIVEE